MIDTFSGIGGFSLAARWLGGIETVAFVEREPFCQQILRKHWPTVPIHDDICTYKPTAGAADVICGGFPCQDISQAGNGAGLAGSRSGLFYELLRVVRLVGPRYIVLENVAAITYRGMDDVLGALAEAGYDAEWACISAAAVGACHRRDRWWCVAYANHARVEAQGAKQQPAGLEQHGELAADTQGEQRYDGGPADPAGAAGAAAKSGDGDGADAAYPYSQRLERPHQLAGSRPQWPAAPCRLNPDWGGYTSEPVLCRGDDGLSGRVDRLKALGNAVVPQVAMIPLARVLGLTAEAARAEAGE
jgi:DNA (cytosine-5)-methyltransferase 1